MGGSPSKYLGATTRNRVARAAEASNTGAPAHGRKIYIFAWQLSLALHIAAWRLHLALQSIMRYGGNRNALSGPKSLGPLNEPAAAETAHDAHQPTQATIHAGWCFKSTAIMWGPARVPAQNSKLHLAIA